MLDYLLGTYSILTIFLSNIVRLIVRENFTEQNVDTFLACTAFIK